MFRFRVVILVALISSWLVLNLNTVESRHHNVNNNNDDDQGWLSSTSSVTVGSSANASVSQRSGGCGGGGDGFWFRRPTWPPPCFFPFRYCQLHQPVPVPPPPPPLSQLPDDQPSAPPLKSTTPSPSLSLSPSPSRTQLQMVFADERLAAVYPIIQRFKLTISSDPLGITSTWVGPDICSYKGLYCDTPPDNASATALASVDFNGYRLAAPTLDGFLDQLPDLALFHANSNYFSSNLSSNPNFFSRLKFLYELDLSNNLLSGPFPSAVLAVDGLSFLDLRFNRFSGSVPPSIFTSTALQSLQVLFLNDNALSADLLSLIGSSTTHISYLTLSDNKFSGPIPRDIYRTLFSLTEVVLLNNSLTGCLPYELGLLDQVTLLDVSNNRLTGPLPVSLTCLKRVEIMNFSGNLLFGVVPDLICHKQITNFSLADNYLVQVGPACGELIARGVMDVSNNCIPGFPGQRSVMECANFFARPPSLCPFTDTYALIPCNQFQFP